VCAHLIPYVDIGCQVLKELSEAFKVQAFYVLIINLFRDLYDILFILFQIFLLAKSNEVDLS
jgi:hypothetical protein